jgi:hypothetical protein
MDRYWRYTITVEAHVVRLKNVMCNEVVEPRRRSPIGVPDYVDEYHEVLICGHEFVNVLRLAFTPLPNNLMLCEIVIVVPFPIVWIEEGVDVR